MYLNGVICLFSYWTFGVRHRMISFIFLLRFYMVSHDKWLDVITSWLLHVTPRDSAASYHVVRHTPGVTVIIQVIKLHSQCNTRHHHTNSNAGNVIFIYLIMHILQIQTVIRDVSRSSIKHAVNTSGKWNLYKHFIYKKKKKLINEMWKSFY